METNHSTKNILLIEDDRDIRDALCELLESEGYVVTSAQHGQDGLDQLKRGCKPSLILLDLMMPIKDGYQFRIEQQSDPSISPIPVVVMSADNQITQKAQKIEANGYLKKPVEIDALLEMVQRFFH